MMCWACVWPAQGALKETNQTLLPSTQAYLQLKAMEVMDVEDYDTSHCYIYSSFIVAALFLEMEAIE